MAIEKDFFRQVMGRFATGVTVVTTNNQGTLAGLTVNAFCSVSLYPPLVLVCVDLTSATLPHIRESGAFAVNILTKAQEDLSRCFATPSVERYENFCHAEYQTVATGSPVLKGTLAFVDTRVVAEYPGGDHAIFLGQVEAMGMNGQMVFANDREQELTAIIAAPNVTSEKDDIPLAYYLGQYRHIADAYHTPSLSATVTHDEH